MSLLHINRPGEMRVIRSDDLGERWCFICRKRQQFTLEVKAEIEPSYYDPNPSVHCSSGHDDGDCFPGTYRIWDY